VKKVPMTNDVAKTCEKKLQDCLLSLLDLHLPSVVATNRFVAIYDDTRLMCDKFADVYGVDTEQVEDVNTMSVKGVEISLPDIFVHNNSIMLRCFAFPMFNPSDGFDRPRLLLLFMFGHAGKQTYLAAYAEDSGVELTTHIVRTCDGISRLGVFLDSNLVAHGISADAESLIGQLRANDMPIFSEDDAEEFDLDTHIDDEDEDEDDLTDDLTDDD
jgi:hypothetical protein